MRAAAARAASVLQRAESGSDAPPLALSTECVGCHVRAAASSHHEFPVDPGARQRSSTAVAVAR